MFFGNVELVWFTFWKALLWRYGEEMLRKKLQASIKMASQMNVATYNVTS